MQGAGIMFAELTGMSYWVGLVLVWATYTGFILYSGSPGVMLTDTIMFVIFSLAVFYALMMTGAAINLYDATLDPERSMVWVALNVLPTWLGVVILTGVFAAGLSSCSTFLSIIGFSLSNDILPASTDERSAMRKSRIAVLAAGLIALLLALFQPPAVMSVVWFAATLFASSWGPVALMSIWSRRITAAGASWGLVVGFVGNVALSLMVQAEWISLPVYLHPVLLSTLLALVAIALASRVTQVSEAESAYRAFLHEFDASAMSGWVSGTRWIALCTMLSGVAIGVFLWQQYAVILAGFTERFALSNGAVSGAYLLAIGCGSMLLIAGAVGAWVVRDRHAKSPAIAGHPSQ
jgi:sodium/pantothenate symporter